MTRHQAVLRAVLLVLPLVAAIPFPIRAQPAPAANCTFSSWLAPADFQSLFNQQAKARNYPATLEGRTAEGKRWYRACFDRQPDFGFRSYWGMSPAAFAARDHDLHLQGYILSYRQSFEEAGAPVVQATWVGAIASGQTLAFDDQPVAVYANRDTEGKIFQFVAWDLDPFRAQGQQSPSCSTTRIPEISVATPARNGTVRLVRGKVNVDGCPPNSFEGIIVFYQPNPGYTGQDQIVLLRKADPNTMGIDFRRVLNVTVR